MSDQSVILDAPAPRPATLCRILGESPATRRLLEFIELVAGSDGVSVLISGESGTGKDLVAREIHARSRRCGQPFVAVNCAALPPSLLESELFGHVRGAFTDAKCSRDGLFVQAGHGTIFLDEIAEMPLDMQAKLLRAVEQRAVRPVGSDAEVAVHARLITATNRQLEAEIAAGRFRHDLYYRINVIDIVVPPLRERAVDILILSRHFADRYSRAAGRAPPPIDDQAVRCLLDYPWPGNVRELENCIQRAVTLSRTPAIQKEDLPERIRDHRRVDSVLVPESGEQLVSLDEMARRYVERVLVAMDGNKTRVARVLGVDRRTFYRLADRLGIVHREARRTHTEPPRYHA